MAKYAVLIIGRAFARIVGYCALRRSIMPAHQQKARREAGLLGDDGKAIRIANTCPKKARRSAEPGFDAASIKPVIQADARSVQPGGCVDCRERRSIIAHERVVRVVAEVDVQILRLP